MHTYYKIDLPIRYYMVTQTHLRGTFSNLILFTFINFVNLIINFHKEKKNERKTFKEEKGGVKLDGWLRLNV